jgi:hypothetical protein
MAADDRGAVLGRVDRHRDGLARGEFLRDLAEQIVAVASVPDGVALEA